MSQTAEVAKAEEPSYGQILKSSALIGGSQVLSIAIGIVRSKAMAMLLGPAGFGLMGLYGSIIDFAQSIAGMGIGTSGVRQIAESVGSGNDAHIAQTVTVLRRTAIFLGILGAVLLVAFSSPLSILTFGSDAHIGAVMLLSLAVFFRLVSGVQGALIQGMRRIHDMAVMGVVGTFLGAVISIILIYFLGEQGVAPSLVGGAAIGLAISWWYSRKIKIRFPAMTHSEMKQEAASLMKLGLVFMMADMLMMGTAYAVRTIILRMDGLDAAGFYSAAWTLGGIYVGIILNAMGADFYPRLVGAAQDNRQCNRLVNEQTQVGLLLAGPGVIATLTFAPLVIALFYSTKFYAAVEVLRWLCLGIALRVIIWPMTFIMVAKNRRAIFVATDVAWVVVNLGLTWICVKSFGVNGAGMAFFGSYVFYGIMMYPTIRRISGFYWSAKNKKTGLIFLFLIAVVFCGFYLLPLLLAYGVGTLAMISSTVYSLHVLLNLVNFDRIPRPMQQLVFRLGFARSGNS